MLAAERALLSDGALTLDGVGELMNMLQDLPAMKAQLEAAQAALEEGEPLLLMAKEGFAEGRKQLDAAKETLIFAEAQLIAGRKALEEKQAEQEETLASLNERKAALEENSHTLAVQSEQLALYTEKKDHFSNLRYALLANDGVAEKTRAGAGLIEAAEQEIDLESQARDREFSFRLAAAVLMLCAALCGVLTVAAAFRDKVGAEKFLATCYSYIPNIGNPANDPAIMGSEETWNFVDTREVSGEVGNYNSYYIKKGLQNTTDPYINCWDGQMYGGRGLFQGIRNCNIFLENADKVGVQLQGAGTLESRSQGAESLFPFLPDADVRTDPPDEGKHSRGFHAGRSPCIPGPLG